MSCENKLLKLFEMFHGPISSSCTAEVYYGTNDEVAGVKVMKDGEVCWYVTREQLMFEFITKDME
ncbi:hypothetical protein [Marinobacter shengliensis]|uniref:hypothetical protein n=1 Tax=Marinobacter shengliensis TaxID=1389223 RepID=UPI001E45A008|nr:hypothetical protein [Marinobacter shengliensis]MCD1628485.1 hypothetical protein [Marinobacter shengliensis]